MDTCCIYRIRNEHSGRSYIGATHRFRQRIAHHRWALRNGRHHNAELQADWRAFGEGVFKFELLLACRHEDLAMFEERTIAAFKVGGALYNRYEGATPRGFRWSPEQLERKSASLIGHECRPETRAKIGGWPRTPEYGARVAAGLRGKPKAEGHRANLSAALKGRKRGPQSAETIAKRVAATRATKMAKACAE